MERFEVVIAGLGPTGATLAALLGNAEFESPSSTKCRGPCRILATCGERRSRFSPTVPTLREQGYPELMFTEWFGFFAPSGTSTAVVDRTHAQIAQALSKPAVSANFETLGMEVQLSTPAELS